MTATEQHALLTMWLTIAPSELDCNLASVNFQVMWNDLNAYTPMTHEAYLAAQEDREWDSLCEYGDWQREQTEYHDMQKDN